MTDVFISYKAEDRRRVQPLVQALQADGLSVWWDEHIGAGDAWRETIEKQLDTARCVLVAWSKRSVAPEGRFVRDEASRAQLKGVYLPVLIDAVKPPLGFGESQATSLRGWRGDPSDPRYQAVLASVRRITGAKSSVAARTRDQPAGVSRRRVVVGSGAVAAVAAAGIGGWALLKPGAATGSNSIAVLPFANLSRDPEQAYFSDGIAEELRSALARLAGMKVVGRTSSEAVRDKDAETAARELGVPNILTGSVRRSTATIRVSAQLIDGTSGMEGWSRSYDRAPGDTIRIQTDIAENVARTLKVALGNAAKAALTVGGTDNAEAQSLLLEAEADLGLEGGAGRRRAIALLDRAITIDPNYAHAYALKASFVLWKYNSESRQLSELARGRAEALRNVQKAISIAPNLPIGHGVLAEIHHSNLDFRAAFAEYRKAMALAPGDPDELRSFSRFLSAMGDHPKALQLADEALSLDPLEPDSFRIRGIVLFNARRYSEALTTFEDFKDGSTQPSRFPVLRGNALTMLGRTAEAQKAYADPPEDDVFRLTGEAIIAARTGDHRASLEKVRKIEQRYGDPASYQYGQIYAQLRDPDKALAALHRAWQIKDAGLFSAKVDPFLDPIRLDRRFAGFLGKVGFPA
jgi:serine/threonine-protein kinase